MEATSHSNSDIESNGTAPPSPSSAKATPGKSKTDKRDAQPKRDVMHWVTIGCFLVSTSFWLTACAIYHPQPWFVVQNALVTLAVCFSLEAFVTCAAPELPTRSVMMHFSLDIVQNLLFIVLFVLSPNRFAKLWASIFFGFYLWTWIKLLTQRKQFFPMFRIFYTAHHTIAFFLTAGWFIAAPCCFEDDNDFVYRAVVIWLSAELYQDVLNIFRSIRPKTDKDVIRKWQTIVFGMERLHRSVAYFQGLTVEPDDNNLFWWVVFGTGLFLDVVDTSFQLHSICKHYQDKRRTKTTKALTACG